jgi:soluble lytic murein transglycosylase-like protein
MKIYNNYKPFISLMTVFLTVLLVHSYFFYNQLILGKNIDGVVRSTAFVGRDLEGKTETAVLTTEMLAKNLEKDRRIAQTEHNPPSVSGKKEEHLYHPIIVQTASLHQLDPALVKAIIMAESGYNSRAISKKGAKGLMQLMPGTAQALGVEDVFDPHQNISGGVRYFKQLVDKYNGDVKLALAAYNAGSKNVRRYNGIPPFKVTQYYIEKVFKYQQVFKKHMAGEVDSA